MAKFRRQIETLTVNDPKPALIPHEMGYDLNSPSAGTRGWTACEVALISSRKGSGVNGKRSTRRVLATTPTSRRPSRSRCIQSDAIALEHRPQRGQSPQKYYMKPRITAPQNNNARAATRSASFSKEMYDLSRSNMAPS
jgi:hypothetical protein